MEHLSLHGLSEQEAQARLRLEGPNELPSADHRGVLRIVTDALREPMFALLLGGGAVYLALGDTTDALVLAVFASLSLSITVIQETRSERVLEALRDLTSPRALVVRDGQRKRVAGREVVSGDILVLVEGDRVAADAGVRQSTGLTLDESLLTGESVPVLKQSGSPVYAGSLVVQGEGLAIVHATGSRSELGKIGATLRDISVEPPRLQAETGKLVRIFAVAGLGVSLLVVVLQGLGQGDWLHALLNGIAVGMSMLPEEFPLVLSAVMVMGAWRLSRARVLTRRAAAIETFGSATVLCTDKTGTLTRNHMTVMAVCTRDDAWRFANGEPVPEALVEVLLCARLASSPHPTEPMERAITERLGSERAAITGEPVRRYGLRPELLAMTNVWPGPAGGAARATAKGAPETIAMLCRLDGAEMQWLHDAVDELARGGMRVLGVAEARCGIDQLPQNQADIAFQFVGLLGFIDPLRPEAKAAIAECHSAGIRVVMITGDHPITAATIAASAGLPNPDVVEGTVVASLDDAALRQRVKDVNVFARIAPDQKLRIVQALKANGEVVAMTGDGVNDAPALKAADIGIAMGGRGTDVARESASIILLDDDFGSIVRTIRLGRRIYDNLRKASCYIVAIHVPIAGLALLPLLFGFPPLLMPVHIAFLEMVIDPACSIAFEAEHGERDLMQRPPRPTDGDLLSRGMLGWSLLQGVFALGALALVLANGILRDLPLEELRAVMFVSLVLTNIGLILVNRSFSSSLMGIVRRNTFLWSLVTFVVLVLILALLWPPAMRLFGFGRLHVDQIALSAACAVLTLIAMELIKPFWRRRFRT